MIGQEIAYRNEKATATLVDWAQAIMATAVSSFPVAQQLSRKLGAHYQGNGRAQFGFWVPDIPAPVYLEIYRAQRPLDLTTVQPTAVFHRQRLPLTKAGEYAWGIIDGLRAGTRHSVGDFYWLTYQDPNGQWQHEVDPLAYSIPFGSSAPAELYDWNAMQAARADTAHFARLDVDYVQDGVPRIAGPTNILQLHVNTASPKGTLAGLTRIYREIGAKLSNGTPLTPAEQNYIGYDAIQLMPIEPTIEYEAGPRFWQTVQEKEDAITVALRPPDMTNWGYDIITVASPAPNPTVLGSKRPDELVDFIATLHNFPGKPIKILFDIVYGHADNQSLPLLNKHYIAGPGMYGQNFDYRQPMVRAILLEMQRRKSNYGVDGLRVDGAQDFKYWDAAAQELKHDDEYLALMNDMVQEVAGVRYLPWMIFEDGRPWPRDDWELASSYREITKQLPNVVQWGPLTFAHNTPFLFTFWVSKWWRIREITQVGSHWITGCANHDTLRRGTQVPTDARLNTYLGDNLPQIFEKGYDNPAAKLFDYAIMPGIPMDFINAAMRAPWSFIRNTDDRWGVKVVSEESRFLDWALTDALFAQEVVFPRLKKLGFTDLAELRRFMKSLDNVVQITDYDLPVMAKLLNAVEPPLPGPTFSVTSLKEIARAWMDDVHELCNVTHYMDDVDAAQAAYNLAVREFRRQRPFLRQNFTPQDYFAYLHPTAGTVLFYGLRHAPYGEQILFIANMEGAPRTFTPLGLPIPNLPQDGWQVALTTPGLAATALDQPLTLRDSEGILGLRARNDSPSR